MARRVDKLARWIAAGLLREQGVTRTPDAMALVMPIAYRLADAAVEAIGEFVTEIAAELAGQPPGSVPDVGELVAALEWREWEAQFASSGNQESND